MSNGVNPLTANVVLIRDDFLQQEIMALKIYMISNLLIKAKQIVLMGKSGQKRNFLVKGST